MPLILDVYFSSNKRQLYCSSEITEIRTSLCFNLFHEKKDIDFLLIGFSSLWVDFYNDLFEKLMLQNNNQKIISRTLATNHPGEDFIRVLYHDFSISKKSRFVFTSQPNRSTPYPHPYLHHVATFSDLKYLSLNIKPIELIRYYSLLSLRSFKNVISIITPFHEDLSKFKNIGGGSSLRKKAWLGKPFVALEKQEKPISFFNIPKVFLTTVVDDKVIDNSLAEKISAFQQNALLRFNEDVLRNGQIQGFLYFPLYLERREKKMIFKMHLEKFPKNTIVIGSPGEKLFENKTDEEIQEFFYNDNHMNFNGAVLFTTLMTPILGQLIMDYKNE